MWPEKSRWLSVGSTLDVLCICSERLPNYVRHGDGRDTIQHESIKNYIWSTNLETCVTHVERWTCILPEHIFAAASCTILSLHQYICRTMIWEPQVKKTKLVILWTATKKNNNQSPRSCWTTGFFGPVMTSSTENYLKMCTLYIIAGQWPRCLKHQGFNVGGKSASLMWRGRNFSSPWPRKVLW